MTAAPRRRTAVYAATTIVLSCLAVLGVSEAALRLLPVNDGFWARPVNARNPVFRFTPNREVTWSRDWNFAIVNRVRVNNAGFVNDQDYVAADPRPLLAVVGDSYVEAAMVPYRKTLQGRLAASLAPAARVYSFAASGAPLSQYLVWAKEARERWHASALVVVVVGNDYDESLASVKQGPGFHHYVVGTDGALTLRRVDYRPSALRALVRISALARYLVFNLHVLDLVGRIRRLLRRQDPPPSRQRFAGNTSVDSNARRLAQSKAAVAAFLRDLVAISGWQPGQVLFLVDGFRVPGDEAARRQTYFALMREHFLRAAGAAGFEAVDLDPAFFAAYRRKPGRFDFPTDGHWNARAHGIAAAAARSSHLVARFAARAAARSR